MKKLIVLAAVTALLTGVSLPSFAATKSLEQKCKAQAEKHKIGEDKMDTYIKTCVAKHMKHRKHVKHIKHEKGSSSKPADPKNAPSASEPTPSSPAQSGN